MGTDLLLRTKCCSLSLAQYQHFNKPEEESNENDSGTDSDGDDDSIPELEETAGETAGDAAVTAAAAAGLGEDASSKAKQSRGEKKARKIMSRWKLLGSSRLLKFLSQLRWVPQEQLDLLPFLKKMRMTEKLMRLVWRTRILIL